MNTRARITYVICVLLHIYVVWNVYQADKLTPRVIQATITRCV